MVKYNYSIINLEERLNELKKYYYREKDNTKRQDILYDIELISSVINDYYNTSTNDLSLIELFKNTQNINNQFNYILEPINKFYELTLTKEINTPPIRNKYFNNDDLMTIANDFFAYLGHPFYGYFQKIYRSRKNHIKFISREDDTDTYGHIIFLRYQKEGFLTIKRTNTLEDVMTLIHEIEHNIACLMNPNIACTHFCEIDTILFELLFLDYYYLKYVDNDAIYLKANYFNSALYASDEFINLVKLAIYETMHGTLNNNKILKNTANKVCNYNAHDLEIILKEYTNNKPLTLIGEIYAIELYYIFKQDLNLGEFYLRKVINNHAYTNEQLFNYIKKLGIIPNQNTLNYYKSLNEKVLKISKGWKIS